MKYEKIFMGFGTSVGDINNVFYNNSFLTTSIL